VLASGVISVAIESVDALGAITRVCSESFKTMNTLTISTLSSLVQSSSSSLITDPEAGLVFASNAVASLNIVVSSGANVSDLGPIKDDMLNFLGKVKTDSIANPTAAAQMASTLYAISSLPGKVPSSTSSKSAVLFEQVAASCLDMLLSGSAKRDLASTVAPQLVLGSLRTLNSLAEAPKRRLFSLNEGMKLGIDAIISASRIQVFAIDAQLDETFVREQPPIIVLGIRRLLLSTFKYNVLIVPKTSFLNVTVNVVFVANANLADAGLTALVLSDSPFSTSIATALISPVVYVSVFNAKSSSTFIQQPYSVHAVFSVSVKDHRARKATKADGSDLAERCVVYL